MRVVDPKFAETLRRLRTERGLSLRDLTRASFIGKSTLSELENGRMRPSADMAVQGCHPRCVGRSEAGIRLRWRTAGAQVRGASKIFTRKREYCRRRIDARC